MFEFYEIFLYEAIQINASFFRTHKKLHIL